MREKLKKSDKLEQQSKQQFEEEDDDEEEDEDTWRDTTSKGGSSKLSEKHIDVIINFYKDIVDDKITSEELRKKLQVLEYDEDYISGFSGQKVPLLVNQAMEKIDSFNKYGDEISGGKNHKKNKRNKRKTQKNKKKVTKKKTNNKKKTNKTNKKKKTKSKK